MKKCVAVLLATGMIMMAGCGSSEKVIERDTATTSAEVSSQENTGSASEGVTENGSVADSVQKR